MVCTDFFEITIFWKKQFVKNWSFTNFWFVGQETDSWFTNHEPLIPTLASLHQFLKIMAKKTLKLSKMRREEKSFAQIFKKDLTKRKLERTIIKIMLSASLIGFFTQSSQYQIWKANTYFILTVIELWRSVSESSIRTTKFFDPLILNTNFIKWESKIDYP